MRHPVDRGRQEVTIFADLGGILAPNEVGLDRFLVKHVHDVLMNERSKDTKSRERLQTLVEKLGAGVRKPNITFLRDGGDVIHDGNKTPLLSTICTSPPTKSISAFLSP